MRKLLSLAAAVLLGVVPGAAARASWWPTPSRSSISATAAVGGVRSVISLRRDLIVVGRSAADGAQSSQIVRGGGSSIALSSAFAACSVVHSRFLW